MFPYTNTLHSFFLSSEKLVRLWWKPHRELKKIFSKVLVFVLEYCWATLRFGYAFASLRPTAGIKE
jgi:hypothetical protein